MAKTLCDWSKKDIEGKQVKTINYGAINYGAINYGAINYGARHEWHDLKRISCGRRLSGAALL